MATYDTSNLVTGSSSLPLSPAQGSTIIVFCQTGGGGGACTFSDNTGSTGWKTTSVNAEVQPGGEKNSIGYLLNCPAGITTINCSSVGGPGFNSLGAVAYQPASPQLFVGVTAENVQSFLTAGTDTIVSNSLDCGTTAAMLVGICLDGGGGASIAAGTGFTSTMLPSPSWLAFELASSHLTGSQIVKFSDTTTHGIAHQYATYAIAFSDASNADWAAGIGVNFRSSAGFVTDNTGETHLVGAEAGGGYPPGVTRVPNGMTTAVSMGTPTSPGSTNFDPRDRGSGSPVELAGIYQQTNTVGPGWIVFEVPAPGQYKIGAVMGDVRGGNPQKHYWSIVDSDQSTILSGPHHVDTTGSQWADLQGNLYTVDATALAGGQANTVTVTLTGTKLYLKWGDPASAAANASTIAYAQITQLGASSAARHLAHMAGPSIAAAFALLSAVPDYSPPKVQTIHSHRVAAQTVGQPLRSRVGIPSNRVEAETYEVRSAQPTIHRFRSGYQTVGGMSLLNMSRGPSRVQYEQQGDRLVAVVSSTAMASQITGPRIGQPLLNSALAQPEEPVRFEAEQDLARRTAPAYPSYAAPAGTSAGMPLPMMVTSSLRVEAEPQDIRRSLTGPSIHQYRFSYQTVGQPLLMLSSPRATRIDPEQDSVARKAQIYPVSNPIGSSGGMPLGMKAPRPRDWDTFAGPSFTLVNAVQYANNQEQAPSAFATYQPINLMHRKPPRWELYEDGFRGVLQDMDLGSNQRAPTVNAIVYDFEFGYWVTDVPDLNGPEWQEQVRYHTNHGRLMQAFRQYGAFTVFNQEFDLVAHTQSKFCVEPEVWADTSADPAPPWTPPAADAGTWTPPAPAAGTWTPPSADTGSWGTPSPATSAWTTQQKTC